MRILIYDKIEKMRSEFEQYFDDSVITNLIAVDAVALQTWLTIMPHLISAPFVLIMVMVYIFYNLGAVAILAVVVVILIFTILWWLIIK